MLNQQQTASILDWVKFIYSAYNIITASSTSLSFFNFLRTKIYPKVNMTTNLCSYSKAIYLWGISKFIQNMLL